MRAVLIACVALALTSCASPAPTAGNGPFIVFFQSWSADLDAAARGTIKDVASLALKQPSAVVTVKGFADPTGSEEANAVLSNLRTILVRDELVADGVPAERIVRSAVGSVGYTATALESRRVEIRIGKP